MEKVFGTLYNPARIPAFGCESAFRKAQSSANDGSIGFSPLANTGSSACNRFTGGLLGTASAFRHPYYYRSCADCNGDGCSYRDRVSYRYAGPNGDGYFNPCCHCYPHRILYTRGDGYALRNIYSLAVSNP